MNFKDEKVLLEEAIVKTIAFFDMFDYPLTDFEVWRFVSVECDLMYVKAMLCVGKETKFPIGNLVSGGEYFYFLRGREEIVDVRQKRNKFTDRKFKRALWVVKIYRLIPWVKMVAVSNTIGERNLKDESDIDIFIITEKNKIWLTRFFCAGIAKTLGLRPSEKNSRDKICLNFYISEEEMNLKKFMLDDKDIYFVYWLANLIVIYDKDGTYKKFIQANGWLKNYLPNWQESEMVGRWFIKERKNLFLNFIFNLVFSHFKNAFKKIQLRMLPIGLKELMNKDTRVIINDKVLKLHIKDRREEYRKNYELRIMNYE